jgi:hypothetical protein
MGHSDMLFGRPTPGRPISHPQGVLGVSSYQLVVLFLNMVCLAVALAVGGNCPPLEHLDNFFKLLFRFCLKV